MCVYMKTNQIMNYGDQKVLVTINKLTMQLTASLGNADRAKSSTTSRRHMQRTGWAVL